MFFDESIGWHFRYANSFSAPFPSAETISPETKPLQARPFPTSSRSTIESTELRLHSCESLVLQSPARRIVRQTEEVPVTRLTPNYDGIPRAYDLAESCLESVRSNGNSFTGITSICHRKKCRAMKTQSNGNIHEFCESRAYSKFNITGRLRIS